MEALWSALGRLDLAVFQRVRLFHTAWLDLAMEILSISAAAGRLWMVLGALAAFLRPVRWPAFVQLLLAIGLAGLLSDFILKPVISRQRPFETQLDLRTVGHKPVSRSFPSGHVATAVAGAFTLSLMIPAAALPAWLLAALVAFSRIYLGVHYPIDAIGGAVVGLASAAFVTGGTRWYSDQLTARRSSHPDVAG